MALWGLDFIANNLEVKLSNGLNENKQRDTQSNGVIYFHITTHNIYIH